MELVNLQPKNYQDYLPFIDEHTKSNLDFFIREMKGKRVAMISATSFGGGVAEKLHSLIPLVNSMGVEMDWWVIKGDREYFKVTKKIHNGLQGEPGFLSKEEIEIYLSCNRWNAGHFKGWDYDFVVVHDPQPAALIEHRPAGDQARWIWRCHIDTSSPNQEYWAFLYRYIKQYSATIFTLEDYVNQELPPPNLNTFITPSIDPLSLKNVRLEKEEAQKIVTRYGVEAGRPLISQISRFDPWKDPLGVIEVYKIIKKEFPPVQLALVGSMAADDPEGWDYLYHTLRRAGEDYDIKVVTNFNGVTDLEVNAFQTASDILIQKSLREGFGLTVTEGLWKGTPVIGGNAGGIRLQIEDGVTGFLVDTVEECAEKALILLRNPLLAQQIAAAGKEKVRRQFLVTKNALDYLKLFFSLLRQPAGSG